MTPEILESASDSATRPSPSVPSQEEIAELAYRIWEQEGRQEGHSLEHWRQAESLLQGQRLTAQQ